LTFVLLMYFSRRILGFLWTKMGSLFLKVGFAGLRLLWKSWFRSRML